MQLCSSIEYICNTGPDSRSILKKKLLEVAILVIPLCVTLNDMHNRMFHVNKLIFHQTTSICHQNIHASLYLTSVCPHSVSVRVHPFQTSKEDQPGSDCAVKDPGLVLDPANVVWTGGS